MNASLTTPTRLRDRRRLTTLDIAGMLDEPLYEPRRGLAEVMTGCQRTADARMAAAGGARLKGRVCERMLQDGATELGLLTTPDQLEPAARAAFASRIRAVAHAASEFAVVVKVVLPVSGVSWETVLDGCRVSVDSGAAMVQGGTWFGDYRHSLSGAGIRYRASIEGAPGGGRGRPVTFPRKCSAPPCDGGTVSSRWMARTQGTGYQPFGSRSRPARP